MHEYTIEELLEAEIAFMGGNWEESDEAPEDSPIPGCIYLGEKPYIDCSDLFFWGMAEGEDIELEAFNQAVDDCNGNLPVGSLLYCARQREMRPQGAYYSYFPEELWELFDACGPEREVGFGNPYAPGDYLACTE